MKCTTIFQLVDHNNGGRSPVFSVETDDTKTPAQALLELIAEKNIDGKFDDFFVVVLMTKIEKEGEAPDFQFSELPIVTIKTLRDVIAQSEQIQEVENV